METRITKAKAPKMEPHTMEMVSEEVPEWGAEVALALALAPMVAEEEVEDALDVEEVREVEDVIELELVEEAVVEEDAAEVEEAAVVEESAAADEAAAVEAAVLDESAALETEAEEVEVGSEVVLVVGSAILGNKKTDWVSDEWETKKVRQDKARQERKVRLKTAANGYLAYVCLTGGG
ncbi:hypothetical protein MPH_03301 [Macrophomina phaseolina MS6]|uniref:Uncharacterized protein n=1 Tax=Macrophomina phaseolina (strain MS6) TaxID=1126212 RepID=K2RXF1_MACPH|nr:hypothetical protein MPH_03301 [Macrophomina phaseolina MS6]